MAELQSNFIYNEIVKDIESGKVRADEIYTRFPPEPNGFLHIGHAKAICINFGAKTRFNAQTNLRFDDTNPSKEDTLYTDAIQEDIKWLGFKWDKLLYASDYFDKMYDYAVELIRKGLAYVDDQTPEQIKSNRGDLNNPGIESPYRNRSIDENLKLFAEMKDRKYSAGEKVLRAKIDMSSPNMNMRDPVIYRILYATHHRTGDKWCIYPMYDFAHPLEDAIEGITHSLCSLEFEDHRPLYDWVLDNLDDYKAKRPRQIEFARLNITNTIMSKRYLKALVDNNIADGWDDPILPTLSGLRRKGVTPGAIKNFCEEIGVAKADSIVDYAQFEYFIREDLQKISTRVMAVLDPIRLTITNWPEDKTEYLDIPYVMDDPESKTRRVPFTKHLLIERNDFEENPPKKYYRLFPGNEVRLMGAYFVKCTDFVKDENGNIIEILCTYDPETKSGSGFNARKVKGTIHWVSETENVNIDVRFFNNLLEEPDTNKDFIDRVNKDVCVTRHAKGEISIKNSKPEDKYQFIRNGYFCADSKYTHDDHLVFNRTVELKSSWSPEKK